jgi:hypothetical protein
MPSCIPVPRVTWQAVVVELIRLYERYISPYKGFKCLHALLHGGPSRSAHIKQLSVSAGSFHNFWSGAITRFQTYADASMVLSEGRHRVRCYVIPCCLPLAKARWQAMPQTNTPKWCTPVTITATSNSLVRYRLVESLAHGKRE